MPITIAFCKQPLKKGTTALVDIFSGGKSKEHHEWEQSVKEARHFLAPFVQPGDTLLDPMCGSGTSLLAGMDLGMQCIGIEIDPAAHVTAEERIQTVPFAKSEDGENGNT